VIGATIKTMAGGCLARSATTLSGSGMVEAGVGGSACATWLVYTTRSRRERVGVRARPPGAPRFRGKNREREREREIESERTFQNRNLKELSILKFKGIPTPEL
jgi:hypothetical protein